MTPYEIVEQYGMDMTLPGARARWKEILCWVRADLASYIFAPYILEFEGCKAQVTWKPRTDEERFEERFLRQLLCAQTAEAIGRACCPSFLLKGLASPEDEKLFPSAVVDLEEAFDRLAKTFNLTDEEAYQTRLLAENPYVVADAAIYTCATMFNIIRKAVETANIISRGNRT